MPARSQVWKYFKRSADEKTVKCTLCNAELSYNSSTSAMHNHLRMKHVETFTQSPVKEQQTNLSSFFNTPKKTTSSQKENITQAIAKMIVSDYLPLSMVEGDGFRNLMSIVAPDYEVPCRKTIRTRITKRYEEEKESLTKTLECVSSAAMTTDTWTSTATESYMTVTEHHITDDWQMQSNVLMTRDMPERHTGSNIADRLKTCVSEFGLEGKVEGCTHDNARNMEAAGNMCEEWSDHGCFAHTLQLCIRPAMDVPLVEKVVSKCRKIVGHFKHSTTLMAEMRKRQDIFQLPRHELIQDVCTRWNSTQMMLERMCEQRRVVTDVVLDTSVSKRSDSQLLPSEREWESMSDISAVLKDLTKVTEFMSGEKDVSNSYVFPIVCGLLNKSLKANQEDASVVKKIKDCIGQELERRFKPATKESASSLPALASLLDPRYKRLQFFSETQRQATADALESRLDDIPLRLRERDAAEPTPCKVQKTDSSLDFLVFRSPEKADSDELTEYLQLKGANEKPLSWWKANEERFPRIAVIAKKILAVPATSVPSERVFSSAGILVNKLRNRLSPTLVDKIIFLNKNTLPNIDE